MSFYQSKVLKKIQSVYFKISMFIRGVFQYPAQTSEDIKLFKKVFENFSDKEIKVFEWGSGLSTIYYSEYLREKGIKFQWHSIDNNEVWHKIVKGKINKKGLQSNVQLYLREFLPFWEKPGWDWKNVPPPQGNFSPELSNEKEYINFPKVLDEKFDVLIVDARFRMRCLQTAREALAPGGVVILHDAQKQQYHAGLDDFKQGEFFTTGRWYPFQEIPNQVWVGSMESQREQQLSGLSIK